MKADEECEAVVGGVGRVVWPLVVMYSERGSYQMRFIGSEQI